MLLGAHVPLISRAVCSRGPHCVVSWSPGSFYCGLLTTVGDLVSMPGSHSGCFQALPCAEGIGHWCLGLGNRVGDCGAPEGPWA